MVKKKYKKVFVIGANSFSAGSFINLMIKKKKFKIFGVSRSNLSKNHFCYFNQKNKNFVFQKIDLNKNLKKLFYLIKKNNPNYIVNYASQSMVGQSWTNSADWFLTNSFSTIKLYEYLSQNKNKIKLVHISTPEVYGNTRGDFMESTIYNPTSPYAVSRVTADQYLKILYEKKGFNYCAVRASNVYGPCQKLYRIIPKTIYSILKKA